MIDYQRGKASDTKNIWYTLWDFTKQNHKLYTRGPGWYLNSCLLGCMVIFVYFFLIRNKIWIITTLIMISTYFFSCLPSCNIIRYILITLEYIIIFYVCYLFLRLLWFWFLSFLWILLFLFKDSLKMMEIFNWFNYFPLLLIDTDNLRFGLYLNQNIKLI